MGIIFSLKTIMNIKVMAALGLATVNASTCIMNYSIHTGSLKATCADPTPAAVMKNTAAATVGSCQQVDFDLAGWVVVATQKEYIKIDYCQASTTTAMGGVFFHTYSDALCATASTTHSAVMGGSTACTKLDGTNAYSKWALTLSGNAYGLGFGSGITLFFCQTLLFGLCSG